MDPKNQYNLVPPGKNHFIHTPFARAINSEHNKKQHQQKGQLFIAKYFTMPHNEDDNYHIRNHGDAPQSR